MIRSIGFTILFALGASIPLFTLASIGNRFVQSFGWGGMIKITLRWFPPQFLWPGHGVHQPEFSVRRWAPARKFMSYLLGAGFTWQQVFFACAGTMFVLLLINLVFLKETPRQFGEPEPAFLTPTVCSASRAMSPCLPACGPCWRPFSAAGYSGTSACSRLA